MEYNFSWRSPAWLWESEDVLYSPYVKGLIHVPEELQKRTDQKFLDDWMLRVGRYAEFELYEMLCRDLKEKRDKEAGR